MKVSSYQPMQGFEAATHVAARKPAPKAGLETGAAPAAVISQEELQYFAQLYPDQSKDLSSHSTYAKNGVSPEHAVGSLIDKKS